MCACACSIDIDIMHISGWAIVTFIEHGPSASASAKGSIVLDINTATGPPEEFGLDQPSGPPTEIKTTTTLSIDKLAFKVRVQHSTAQHIAHVGTVD